MEKIVLQRQTAHADAVAGLTLPGLRRTAEPVRSTRLQTFLTVLNFHPLSATKQWLSHQVLAQEASACAACRCKTIFPFVGPTKL